MPKPLKDFEQEIPTQDFVLEALLWLLSGEQSGGCKSVGLGMLPGCGLLVRVRGFGMRVVAALTVEGPEKSIRS